jgi:hypothetical protein
MFSEADFCFEHSSVAHLRRSPSAANLNGRAKKGTLKRRVILEPGRPRA